MIYVELPGDHQHWQDAGSIPPNRVRYERGGLYSTGSRISSQFPLQIAVLARNRAASNPTRNITQKGFPFSGHHK